MSKSFQPGMQGNFLPRQPEQPVFYEFWLLLRQLRWQPLSVSCHFHSSPTQHNTDQAFSSLKLASFLNRVLEYYLILFNTNTASNTAVPIVSRPTNTCRGNPPNSK